MQIIKNSLIKFLLVLGLFASINAHAGIPVIDVTSVTIQQSQLAQAIQQVAAWAQQYQQMVAQYQQAVTMQTIASGSRGMGALPVAPSSSNLPSDWDSALATIKSSGTYATERAKFPTSQNTTLNAAFDQRAASKAAMTNFFALANARIQNVSNLMSQIDTATDPAAKNDLANRLINEQNSIAADKQVMSIIREKLAQDEETTSRAASSAVMCNEFRHAGC
ncbi:type IV secretion system protein [Sulfuriferula nivalis]|uniref:Minor pilin of type IV secretion complex, VirB5 n=1 Tax=Sulfuriferula nivalis TaxID=2675298 RepID=A0A809RRT0_9PROT|nr:type IV secretion system protein [Sulfuriferula nivalis]BBP01581.1 hypothetical protein SFSGTM_22890 [Sulfuriferula nivalis]